MIELVAAQITCHPTFTHELLQQTFREANGQLFERPAPAAALAYIQNRPDSESP
jgi:hypothetical protein